MIKIELTVESLWGHNCNYHPALRMIFTIYLKVKKKKKSVSKLGFIICGFSKVKIRLF